MSHRLRTAGIDRTADKAHHSGVMSDGPAWDDQSTPLRSLEIQVHQDFFFLGLFYNQILSLSSPLIHGSPQKYTVL